MKSVLTISLLFYLTAFNLFSQVKSTSKVLNKEMIKLSEDFHSEIFFKKTIDFYLEKEWDSTLIYSQKQLVTNKIKPLEGYLHFLRGTSFYHKELFNQAIQEYQLITINNKLYTLSKMFLGSLYLEQKDYNKAISYFKGLESLSKKEYSFIKRNSVIHNLGVSYLHLKQFDKAEPYLIKSLEYQKKQQDTLELVGSYGEIANFYYEQYKDDIAVPYFIKAYKLAKSTKDADLKRKTAKNMAVVEENRKDFQKALTYRKEMEVWVDSLNNQKRIYEVAKKEKEFAVKEKQKEVTLLETENKLKETQRNNFIYIASGLLLLLLASGYFYSQKVKSNKIIAQQKEDLDVLNATKDKLFSIVSHDLRSSVNALKRSNVTLLDNLASKNIEALGSLLKKNSAIVNGAYGLLDNLLNWALLQTEQGYFNITSIRLFAIVEQVAYNYKPLLLEKTIDFENSVAKKELIFADQESLKIILRNLLDNAIKFSKHNGSLKIYSRNTSNDFCDLIIEDTGLGMSNETRLKLLDDTTLLAEKEHENVIGTGLGLQLCKSMIKKNNGKFTIESELGKGTKMIVSLPKTEQNG